MSRENDKYNVLDFGARGNGLDNDSAAIQNAIETCSSAGGGTLLFPSGCRFLIGTIYLRDHITIEVEDNAFILGSSDLENYGTDTGLCPYHPEPLDRCLIYGKDLKGLSFTGKGTIDGSFRETFGDKHDDPLKNDREQRPMLIRLDNCLDVNMDGLTVMGAFSWCIHIRYCSRVKLRGMRVYNDRQDGFNIESSQDITISDCTLNCGDDGIALTTSHRNKPLKDLVVTNCIISSRWAAIRLGPLSKGNFENIVISGCVLKNCGGGGIKIGMFEGAEIRNCLFSSIIMENVTAPVLVMNAQWTDIGSTDANPPLMPPGIIRNLVFSDMIVSAHSGPALPWDRKEYGAEELDDFLVRPDRNSTIFLHGHRDGIMEDLSFRNIRISFPGGGREEENPFDRLPDMHEIDTGEHGYWTDDKTIWGIPVSAAFFIRHGRNIDISDLNIRFREPEGRPAFALADTVGVEMDGIRIDGRGAEESDVLKLRAKPAISSRSDP